MQEKEKSAGKGQKRNWFQGLQSEFKKIVWTDRSTAWLYHTGIGSEPAGVLSSVYTMCGGNCIH